MINEIPAEGVFQNTYAINRLVTVIVVGVILLSCIISLAISFGITKPVKKLLFHMGKVRSGDLDAIISKVSNDEIGQLGLSFNEMLEKIKELLQEVKTDQENIRKSELIALQAQINPHFLYNSLDSIYWMTKTSESKEIASITIALAQFFRLGLNKGKEITTVRNELEHVKSYLDIEKLVHKDRFTYTIDVEETILDCECLKIILQPAAENAIIHGFKDKNRNYFIGVCGYRKEEEIYLSVEDNGAGFVVPSTWEKHDLKLHETKGYGLLNVDERIKLRFGDSYGLDISSTPGEGTRVIARIPYKQKQEG